MMEDQDKWVTLLIIVFSEEKMRAQKDVWEVRVEKANSWMQEVPPEWQIAADKIIKG